MNGHDRLWYRLLRIDRRFWRMGTFRSWLKSFILIISVILILGFYTLSDEPCSEFKTHKTIGNFITNATEIKHESINEEWPKRKCSSVHIAMVCAGYNSTQSLVTVVKSIMFYRSRPLHFHFLVDETSRKTLKTLFDTWNLPQVEVSLHPAEIWIPSVSWIPNTHYSGVYGLLKLILQDALNLEKVLVLDTDVTILTDISVLWDFFEKFKKNHALGLTENQSDWYKKKSLRGHKIWPAIGRGFNTGVMLMNLRELRRENFSKIWTEVAREVLRDTHETALADQDVINSVIKKLPHIVFTLECIWNVQLSDHTLSESCYSDAEQIKILHWNSPRKQDVLNEHASEFNRMHKVFLEMDGNLLRRRLFGCTKSEYENYTNRSDPCSKFTKGSMIIYRTHLFFFEYQYNFHSKYDIALVTQCSADRINLLDQLCNRWPGTISVALYLTDAELQHFIDYVRTSEILQNRKNIAYHIVYKDGDFYPINYLRNIATSQVLTQFVFQLDIDFLLQTELYPTLMTYLMKLNLTESNNTALIVPAFETQRYRFTFPSTKDELLKYLNYGVLYTFRYHVWTKGHAATNYSFWKTAVEPYEVSWEPDFEPYVVVAKSAPQYDQRFIGFGWNKVSFITHLTALGYKYIVLPDSFIIHRPHSPSLDIGKFRSDSIYRRCLKRLKEKFVGELMKKYGEAALSRGEKKTKDRN